MCGVYVKKNVVCVCQKQKCGVRMSKKKCISKKKKSMVCVCMTSFDIATHNAQRTGFYYVIIFVRYGTSYNSGEQKPRN